MSCGTVLKGGKICMKRQGHALECETYSGKRRTVQDKSQNVNLKCYTGRKRSQGYAELPTFLDQEMLPTVSETQADRIEVERLSEHVSNLQETVQFLQEKMARLQRRVERRIS